MIFPAFACRSFPVSLYASTSFLEVTCFLYKRYENHLELTDVLSNFRYDRREARASPLPNTAPDRGPSRTDPAPAAACDLGET